MLARKTAAIADKGAIEIDQDGAFFYLLSGKAQVMSPFPGGRKTHLLSSIGLTLGERD